MNYKIILFLTISRISFGQTDSTKNTLTLNEIVVSATKFEQSRRESASQIELISKQKIAFQNTANTANLLEQSGNVFVQRSQGGGGSPVLRGFESSRVLIVMDGIRMNNAIYRAGHLQNVLRVDQNMLERVEVIFGPNSVQYGSDALGGVMHFRTRNPELNQVSANAFTRYSSAINEKTGHIDFNLGTKKLASLTSFTFSDFGDVIQGSKRTSKYPDFGKRPFYVERQGDKDVSAVNPNPNRQIGSAYSQYDLLQKFSFQQSERIKHSFNFQYSKTNEVPRFDRLTEIRNGNLRFAEWYYGPEKRLLAAYQLDLKDTKIYDRAFLSAAYQGINESRISRAFNAANRKSQFEKVKVYSLNADFQKTIGQNTLNYGLEAASNDVNSTAIFTTIATGATKKADTRYADGKVGMSSFAVYLTDQINLSDKLIASAGLRLNASKLSAEFIDKTFFPFPFNSITQQNEALTGKIGLVFNPTEKTKISVLGSSGYRTPNVDDLSKVFESAAGTLIVPNPTIKPEYSYNGELSLSQQIGSKIRFEGTYFYTSVQNVIVVDAFTLNGQSIVKYLDKDSKVVAAQNKAKATINGWNLNLYAVLTDGLTLKTALNSTKGIVDDSKNTPLDHIPPVFGRTGLQYDKNKIQAEIFSIYNGAKKLKDYSPSGEDNLIYATPDGMPAWWTLNIRTAYKVNKNLQIQAACENIFDKNYRNFASGISAAGRNFMLTLRVGI
jgi:hemoglobin/transferrin/lactoferrin receptor protein